MDLFRPKTKTELQEHRKYQLRKIGGDFLEKFITSHPHMMEISNPVIIKPMPSQISYLEKPKIRTKSELEDFRKKQSLIENELTKNFNCKTLSQRVEERERLMALNSQDRVSSNFHEKRRSENVQEFEQKFSKRPVGVHGEELPKFTDHLQDYWKLKQGYVENPYVKEKERPPSRPISEFSRLRVKASSSDYEITSKPNEVNPFPGFYPVQNEIFDKRASSRSRFTDELLFYSRPSSQMNSVDSGFIKGERPRPGSVAENAKNFANRKARPFTAGSKKKGDNLIRSSGFSHD